MKTIADWREFPKELRGGVLCVGNFDGVHLGHAQMLSTGREEARRRGVSFSIMTFDPHPAMVLKPNTPRRPLTTTPQRLELLAGFSPDVLLVIPTTREFLAMAADDFLMRVVRGDEAAGIGATLLVEGPSFTYGKGARGTVQTLREAGPRLGFETVIVPTQEQSLCDLTVINVSSSIIRWLVEQGRVADAARALGRPYTLRGTVVEGQKRGRTIGFPTANLQSGQLLPAAGVYAGTATVVGENVAHRTAISVGTNPTFAGQEVTVEAFLLDYAGDLYGRTLDVAFCRWVRDMTTFAGVDPLVNQMNRDVDLTRRVIGLVQPPAYKEPA